jgi:hypothetical protein
MDGCTAKIDLGIEHCCGGLDAAAGDGGFFCGRYVCGAHLADGPWNEEDVPDHVEFAICDDCADRWKAAHPTEWENW